MKKASVIYAVQVKAKGMGKKVLAFKKGKRLYFCFDKKTPPPALFETKKEAKDAVKVSKSLKTNGLITFSNEVEMESFSIVPVKVELAA